MKKIGSPPLHIVADPDLIGPQPTRSLGEAGLGLWRRITEEFLIEDSPGRELLTLACQSLDRAEALSRRISEDGEILRGPAGPKAHPGIREEAACRSFVVKVLTKLGIFYEPLRGSLGRPPKA